MWPPWSQAILVSMNTPMMGGTAMQALLRAAVLLAIFAGYAALLNHVEGADSADIGGGALGLLLVILLAAGWAARDARAWATDLVVRTWLVAGAAFALGYAAIAVVHGGESAGQLLADLALLTPVMFVLVAGSGCFMGAVVPRRHSPS